MVSDDALAPLLGLLLITATVVTVSTGLGVALYTQEPVDAPVAAGFHVKHTPERLEVSYVRGPDLPAATGAVHVLTAGGDVRVPLTALEPLLGPHWEAGESLCIAGGPGACATNHAATEVEGLRIVGGDQLLFEWAGNRTATTASPPAGNPAAAPGPGGGGEDEDDEGEPAEGSGSPPLPPAPPALPDLAGTVDGATPAFPAAGDAVRLTASITNGGAGDAASSFVVRFLVDGATLSSHSVAPLASGGSLQVLSAPWTASAGEHPVDVVVDADGAVTESDETNNQASTTLVVTAAVFDPGHSYEDLDCDLVFDAGQDVDVTAEVASGLFTTPQCLVITPSQPTVHPGGAIAFTAKAMHVGTALHTSGNQGTIDLVTTGGDLTLAGIDVHTSGAGGAVALQVAGNATLAAGTTLHASGAGSADLLNATGDVVLAPGVMVTLSGNGGALAVTAGGGLTADGASVRATGKDGVVTLTSEDDLTLDGASLETGKNGLVALTAGSAGSVVSLEGVAVEDGDDVAVVLPCDATVVGTPAAGGWAYGPCS